MKVIQVVGFKNSGKTTVSSNVITYAASKGIKTGSVKHHSHGAPDVVPGTDSDRHLKAGATLAGVEGGGIFNVSLQLEDYDFDDILRIYELINVEVLVVEGYKEKNYPKIVCIGNQKDFSLLDSLENVQAVFLHSHLSLPPDYHLPAFTAERLDAFEQWIDSFINL
ncbi:molybdopterin-guanine dinucleotide biosynthesis protein B [Bacillus haikouensis]|nr:molybdopterin-guanine dinucleotide biosynthesis protein B [Bacillus haikouensis]